MIEAAQVHVALLAHLQAERACGICMGAADLDNASDWPFTPLIQVTETAVLTAIGSRISCSPCAQCAPDQRVHILERAFLTC